MATIGDYFTKINSLSMAQSEIVPRLFKILIYFRKGNAIKRRLQKG